MKALVSGNSQKAKKVSVTGAVRLRKCKNTEFVCRNGDLVKRGFVKVAVSRAVRLRECPLGLISTDSFVATHVNARRF